MSDEADTPITDAPIADGVPLSRAWRDGRRIYIVSAKDSPLSNKLWELGAAWDRDMRAHYVGTGKPGLAKLEQVLPLIREAEDRAARVQAVKDAGHWIAIPIGAKDIREHAKLHLGAIWGGDGRKEWALPTAQARDEVAAMIAARPAPKTGRTASGSPGQSRSSQCAECGKRRGKHFRTDSSGIGGMVCDFCNREPDYALSFA